MAETIERAQASDPKRLQAQVRQLQRELAERPAAAAERVEVPVLANGALEELRATIDDLVVARGALEQSASHLLERSSAATAELAALVERLGAPAAAPAPRAPERRPAPRPRREAPAPASVDGDVHLKAGAVRILETLAGLHPVTMTKAQVGTLTGFKITGGTFQTYWSTLKRAGYVIEDGGEITVTAAGLDRAGTVPPAPATTEETVAMWGERLKRGAREMLEHLVRIHPDAIAKDELAEALEMTASGGTYQTYLSTLRRNGLAVVDGQNVRAGEALFITGGTHG